jgi:Tol biopolymer transport system component
VNLLDLFRAPMLGGDPQHLVHDIDSNVSFSPDGTQMVYFRANSPENGRIDLLSAAADGRNERWLLNLKLYALYLSEPAWSPDGKIIAFTEDFAENSLGRIQLLDLSSGKMRLLYPSPDTQFSRLTRVDNSDLAIVYQSKASNLQRGQIGIISYPEGDFRTITNDTNNYTNVQGSIDGGAIVSVQSRRTDRIVVSPADGASAPQQILSVNDTISGRSWTPDGDIVYARANRLVRHMQSGAEQPTFVSDPAMPVSAPDVCSDRKRIVFLWRFHDGTVYNNVAIVNMDGSGQKQLTVSHVLWPSLLARRARCLLPRHSRTTVAPAPDRRNPGCVPA